MDRLILFVVLLAGLQLTACKKNGDDDRKSSVSNRKPKSILMNWKHNGTTWVRDGYMILDLDHAENKDKSYFTFDLVNTTSGFKFKLKKGPLPIDSLAENWPAEARDVSFGYSNDMIVNQYMRLQSQTTGPRFNYRYDSIHKYSTGIYMVNYLHNPLYAGSMARENPQGRATGWRADGAGNSIPSDIIYYFSKESYSEVSVPGYGGIALSGLLSGYNPWIEVDMMMTFESTYNSYLFFDVDEWRFLSFESNCPSSYGTACLKGTVQYVDWRSMNELMNWPEGWGKK
ncbi:MAG: hypothetical protein ACTHMC_24925 [Pseudobacter sp.]|uniref:hypothetical protein n=1 Tax=Pseudobacter sp. TaxID=2045420 RepID=UPI003F7E3765